MTRLTIALLSSLLLTGAAFAAPTLRGDVTVDTPVVTVGDMFDDPGDMAATAIFRAPAPGTTGIVPLADVQHAAEAIGLSAFDAAGYTRVVVVRTSTVVDASVLDRLIDAELASRGVLTASITADIRYDVPNPSFDAEKSDSPATLATLRYNAGSDSFAARFTIAGIDQPVDLTGTIDLMTTAPRLVATHPAGDVLAAADLEMAAVPLAQATAGGYADLDQLVGKQLVRQSRAGLMLKPDDVTSPTVVTRNTLVTVVLKAGAMTLTVKGQSLTTAAAGEPVDVLNTATKKVLHGVAEPDGTVQIVTAVTAAGL
ncbi:MAG TPA: flagellar basal body P-ring formation chaperone FlgA [Devosia sp.]|jgi:flagella basal body P-ring formation protein FlgA|nr:flagellar basal body P-ring formation chaperone FlgA [Devosia sp.]